MGAGELNGHRSEAALPQATLEMTKAPEVTTAPQEKGTLLPAQEHDVVLHRARLHEKVSDRWSVGKNKIIRLNPAKGSGQERA